MNLTKIEWMQGGFTWNPVTGCPGPKISPGCANCYAERTMNTRLRHLYDDTTGTSPLKHVRGCMTNDAPFQSVWMHWDRLEQPSERKKPSRIFVCSMGDLFHPSVPDEWIDTVFEGMEVNPQHTFMLLTKRPERMEAFIRKYRALPNIRYGITICNQDEADKRLIPFEYLRNVYYYLSLEPLLGAVKLEPRHGVGGCMGSPVRLVIVGGETGQNARPMHPDWVRGNRDACAEWGVPFCFKGWGEWEAFYDRDHNDPDWRRCPKVDDDKTRYLNLAGGWGFHGERVIAVRRVGKRRSGRLLDGMEHNEVPS